MPGPIVALLLLTSPAAGPVDSQLCLNIDADSYARCQTRQLQTQVDDLQQQVDRMRQQERARQWETPTYTTPGVSLPSSPSRGASNCFGLC